MFLTQIQTISMKRHKMTVKEALAYITGEELDDDMARFMEELRIRQCLREGREKKFFTLEGVARALRDSLGAENIKILIKLLKKYV